MKESLAIVHNDLRKFERLNWDGKNLINLFISKLFRQLFTLNGKSYFRNDVDETRKRSVDDD
ncbi:CLUMA_CG010378, isoform A [Clunio marinus]|uniref:CLUMA_CG010378, isoform A n=1 Tax=Clunio marinus TaxID=568069 RepID=A0A1J1I9J6_9DIPT|nr:CLUMA_CG010378, isoform A [Clunio marinus]